MYMPYINNISYKYIHRYFPLYIWRLTYHNCVPCTKIQVGEIMYKCVVRQIMLNLVLIALSGILIEDDKMNEIAIRGLWTKPT